ncbi:cell adhesion molecule DSCAML1-like [Uloborus diversus]|uniref:cell adhesion molecule DSCAML1-like n=1 Tax=Uloborus diversus TaxID=327109 RepID=UPI002408FA27|nr:cell adhesion molecule DSCAML1-like [Uloborus diversus]
MKDFNWWIQSSLTYVVIQTILQGVLMSELPKIKKFTFEEKIQEGDIASVACLVVSTTKPLSFTWEKDGDVITESAKNIRIDNSGDYSVLIINDVSLKSSGNYTCRVSNSFGSATHTARLEIKVPPKWIVTPKNIVTTINSEINVQCIASGSPTPKITWQKFPDSNSAENSFVQPTSKDHGSDGVLTVLSVSDVHAGYYECVADNGVSPNIKANFSITIRGRKIKRVPEIQKFFFQDNIVEGKVVSVTCLAVSILKPLHFQWHKNGKSIDNAFKNVRIENSAEFSVLILDGVTHESEGNYTCTATNSAGASKYSAFLNVKAPPKWSVIPADEVVAAGERLVLNCLASGSPTPNIVWKKYTNQNVNPEILNAKDQNERDGKLILSSVSYKDAGLYECVADNGVNPSIAVNFTVTIRVKIEPFSFLRRFKIGEKAQVTCLIASTIEDIAFQWLKDGFSLEESNNIRLKSGNDFSILIVDPVDLQSEGNYTCKASDGSSSTLQSAYLHVEASPIWTNEITDIVTALGSSVLILCRSHGSPMPVVKLRKISGHPPQDSVNKLSEITSKNGTFTFASIKADDSGVYICEANNGVGSSITKNFSITVEGGPKIQPFQFPSNAKIGDKVTVACSVKSASEIPKFRWLKNSHDFGNIPEIRIKNDAEFSVLIIDPVQENSTGNYSCIASNKLGEDIFSSFLRVEGPPKWLHEPFDITASIGDKITLKCEASGYPKPQVSWFRVTDEKEIKEFIPFDKSFWNESFLIIPEANSEHSGTFLCEASNGISPKLTSKARVQVIVSPKIQPFYFKKGIKAGDKATILCLAETRSPLTYSWRKDGEQLTEKDEIRFKTDEELSILIIDPIRSSSSGNYTCTVKSIDGTDSFSSELIVEASPTWIIRPENVTALPGTRHSFRCSAKGSPSPLITWRKLSSLNEMNEHIPKTVISNGGTLVFESMNLSDDGLYGCEANLPKIPPIAFPPTVKSGWSTKALCTVVKGLKPIQFQWKYNNKDIQGSDSAVVITSYEDFSVINIDPVYSKHSGNYTCIASNAVGEDKFTAVLAVHEPTSWVREPEDKAALETENVVLFCSAAGLPSPQIKWFKYDSLESNADGKKTRVNTAGNGTLTISSITVKDAGKYECEANNGVGTSLRKVVTVTVNVPAKFEEKFAVVHAKKGDSARMKCEALGDQPLSVSWHRDDTVISKGGDERYEIFETMEPKAMVSELIIRTTDRDDGALYSCVTENEFGSDERKIRLLVMEVPAAPLDVKIREIWSRSSSVSWAPPYSGNSPITKYIVQYWRDIGGAPHRLLEISAPSSQSSALLKDLHPGTSYVLKVVAENAVGRGEPSDAAYLKTGEEEPNSPPADIIAEPRGSSTIRVSWKPPPKDSWNGLLKGYYVGYKSRDSSQPYSYKSVDFQPDVQQEFFLTHLLKASDYSVVVKAFNGAGSGPPSHELYVRTLDGDLPPAPSVYVIATSATSVSLRWNTRKIDNPLSGYTVHYREDQGQWQEVAVVAPEDNTYTLSNLHPQKMYQIYVTATNQYGKGDPSEIVAIKTGEGDGHSLLSVSSLGPNSSYFDMAVVIPVTFSLLTIGIVLIVACVCVKKIRSRHNLERALAAEKHLAMVGTLQRYVDIDKTRSLMDPNRAGLYPLPYETIQMMSEDQDIVKGQQELRAFINKDGTQTLYNKPMTLRRTSDNEHIYDSAQ